MTNNKAVNFFHTAFIPFARLSLFIIYVWFGLLKIFGLSPASELVHQLFDKTIHVMQFDTFYVVFACFEVLIGMLFLFPRLTNFVTSLIVIHVFTTLLPLIVLPYMVWQSFLVPTLEGQYIIKNLLIIACVIGIVGSQRSA